MNTIEASEGKLAPSGGLPRLSPQALMPVATFCGIVCLWEAASRWLGLPEYLLPSPTAIARAGLAVDAWVWWDHIQATLRVIALGFLLAFAVSLPLAAALHRYHLFRKSVYPLLIVVQSTPVVAIAPILIVTLGATDLARVVITALITFFPLVVGIATGLAQTPPELLELSRALKASVRNEYLQIRLPFALPHVFSAVRVAITLAVIGAVIAEFVASERGIGYFLRFSTSYFKIAQAFAALGVLVVMSLALFHLVTLVQRLFYPRSLPVRGGE
ncbi:Riboflavin transport system permease protein RibX [Cupriavidus yeoncheonensis]|uniref:Riboflavin transport system permease protein RibX n=1 Tax=Cupriavidus yeoncheonensis TaxID=1462994 RepID=A0A916IZX4_9BURK|nr:ABC transporter permease [Cupriavidus yeoncheonensis]CAG2150663.1 Riboflavin transport system permease protein RibX [Cupriavidus yeoncheonensis]